MRFWRRALLLGTVATVTAALLTGATTAAAVEPLAVEPLAAGPVAAGEPAADSFAFRLFGGADDPARVGNAQVMARYRDTATKHPNWFLTVGGKRFEYSGYPAHWHTDVAATGYKERWTANVLADLRSTPDFDGVFVDNQLTKIVAYTPGGVYPDQYRTAEAGQAAYQTFIDYVGQQVRGAGFEMMANMADARLTPGLWNRYSAQQSGGFDEFWTTFGGTDAAPNNLPAYEPSGWQAQLAEVQSGKTGVFSAQSSGGRCGECARYGFASFLLADDGNQLFMESNVDTVVGDWVSTRPMYSWRLGAATSGRTTPQPNLYQRTFEHGLVLVNADDRTARTVALPRTYLDEAGNPVTSIQLPPKRARILRLP